MGTIWGVLRDNGWSNGSVGGVAKRECSAASSGSSGIDLVGVEMVREFLRQEHVLDEQVRPSGPALGHEGPYLKDLSGTFYMRETR